MKALSNLGLETEIGSSKASWALSVIIVGGPPLTTPLKNVRWRVSNWSLDPNDKSLELNGNTVLVKDAGKYSVYGQVTFFSIVNQDLFHVHVNDQPWITCTASQTVSFFVKHTHKKQENKTKQHKTKNNRKNRAQVADGWAGAVLQYHAYKKKDAPGHLLIEQTKKIVKKFFH